MDSTMLNNIVKLENDQEFDWLCMEEPFRNTTVFAPPSSTDSSGNSQNNFFKFDTFPYEDPHCDNHFPLFYEFKDFGHDLNNNDFLFLEEDKLNSFYELFDHETKPQQNAAFDSIYQCDSNASSSGSSEYVLKDIQLDHREELRSQNKGKVKRTNGRSSSKSAMLELDEIQKYFNVPISRAAKEMKVGLTVLKKRCRELNIMRWPHRKIKSLKSLIHNVKETGLTKEIEMLEEHKRLLEKLPQMELTDKTKKLRQACFKANYKKRRFLQALSA